MIKHIFFNVFILILIGCKTTQNVSNKIDKQLPIKMNVENVKIHESLAILSDACEPSIFINPSQPQNIIAGSVLDNVHISKDGGKTWQTKDLKSKQFGVYGDPCLVADHLGNQYYLHLSNPDGKAYSSKKFLNSIVIQKSTDGGKTWNDGVAIGKNEPKQQDKEWAVIHPKTGQIYVTWTEFDKYGSIDSIHKSRIQFATSTDFGKTFSDAITISNLEGDAKDDDETTEGAVPAVDTDGNIYVAWSVNNQIHFDSSFDGGKTWTPDTIIANQIGGWTQDIPDVGRANGMPVTVVDNSDSPNKGTIYINWTDQRNGKDNTDIFLIKSTDKGKTWSEVVKVNQDKTNTHQFFTWMSVDSKTGYIYIVYYDRSKYTVSQTDVVMAISKNGGTTFENYTISESPFVPSDKIFFGDYNNISAYDGMVRPIWTRYENGMLSIWTALIKL